MISAVVVLQLPLCDDGCYLKIQVVFFYTKDPQRLKDLYMDLTQHYQLLFPIFIKLSILEYV